MFQKPPLHLIIYLVAASLILSACPAEPPAPVVEPTPETPVAPDEPAYGGTLVVSYAGDLTSLDPPSAWSTMEWGSAALLLYHGLYVFDPDMQLAPELAAAMPEISDDGTVYTIPLREGVQFHNGRELTAADVKYSIERNAMPGSGSWAPGAPMANIVGGQALMDGEADEAEGIRIIDDHMIEFQLLEPNAYFLHTLTMVTNYIVPREEVERWGEDFRFNPVGTGPFILREWIPGETLVFDSNPNYFKEGLPYLDEIVYDLGRDPSVSLLRFERGEVDILADGIPVGDIELMATDPEWSDYFFVEPEFLFAYLGFQLETPPFDDRMVREAITMAIDRDRLIRLKAGTGFPINRLYSPVFECHSTDEEFGEPYPYDPERARELLAEAGYPDGFTVEGWFAPPRAWSERVPEAVQSDLAEVGVDVELMVLESAVGAEMRRAGEIPIFIHAWGASFPDPFNHVTEIFSTDAIGAGNTTYYSNERVDELAQRAITETDPDARCEIWKEIETIIFQEDLPAVPLFFEGWPGVRPPRVEDFVWHPMYKRPWYELLWIPEDKQ